MSDYKDKSIAVIGMARTGLAVAEVMTRLGARVIIYDKKAACELGEAIAQARNIGAEPRPGDAPIVLDGIDLVVPSPGVPRTHDALREAVRRGIEVVSEIELAYRIAQAPIIAVTGTNGKTTTTVLIGRILQTDGRDAYIAGNVAAGELKLPLIKAAYQAGPDAVIAAEISSFQLEWITNFRPRVAALLNVTGDHLDRHADIEEYGAVKTRIFENQESDDFAIINAENPICKSLASGLSGHLLQFARLSEVEEGAFVRGDDLVVRIDGRESVVCKKSDIRLRGEHNVENVLAAACAAVAFGADPKSVRDAVSDFRGVEHRLEEVAKIDGVLYINNSMCTNVDAAVRSIEAIDEPQIVIAGGKDKNADYTALGQAFKRKAKHVVLIGADADMIADAARQAGFESVTLADSMLDAVKKARAMAKPGDVVVLTPGCASYDMFRSFEERGCVFKQIVRQLETEEKEDGAVR